MKERRRKTNEISDEKNEERKKGEKQKREKIEK